MSKYLDKMSKYSSKHCIEIHFFFPSPNATCFVTFLALQSQNSQREKDKLIRSRVRSLAQKIVSIFERNELLLFLSFISYSYTYKLRINLYFYTYLKLLLKYWFREFF